MAQALSVSGSLLLSQTFLLRKSLCSHGPHEEHEEGYEVFHHDRLCCLQLRCRDHWPQGEGGEGCGGRSCRRCCRRAQEERQLQAGCPQPEAQEEASSGCS